MIVNNAAQQPDKIGHQSFSHSDVSSGDTSLIVISTDSMAYYYCMSLGKAIAASPLFNDVRICDDVMRRDSLFFLNQPFNERDVERLCNEYDVDALISLDMFFFKTLLVNYLNKHLLNYSYVLVILTGEVSMAYPGCPETISFPFEDSLIMKNENLFLEENQVYTIEDVKYTMHYLSEYVGEKMQNHFVPFWSDDNRWFYKNFASGWKRATAYADAQKWKLAADEWRLLYARASKWKQRALLASNLALCYELTGDFPKAIEYAEISSKLFMENADDENKFRKMQSIYLDQLRNRLIDDQKLSQQLHE